MQIGIFAKSFPGTDPATVLRASAEAGYDGVQYNMACSGHEPMPEAISDEAASAVASAAKATGLQVYAVSGTYNMVHPDLAVRQEGHRRLEVLAASCRFLGTGLVTLCTGTLDPHDQWRAHPGNGSPDAWRDLLQAFETAIGIAERHDILLGVEPELANIVSSASQAARLIAELQSPRIRIVLDPANLFEVASLEAQRRLISEAVNLLGDRLSMAHAKDRLASGDFAAAGKGVVDFPHFFRVLKTAGFDGPVVTHGLSAAEAPGVAAFLRKTLEAV